MIMDYFLENVKDKDTDIVLHNAGFAVKIPNYTCGYENRDYYLIQFVGKGKGTYTVGDKSYPLKKNDGFLVLPDQIYMHQADGEDPWSIYWVGFSGKMAKYFLDKANLNKNNMVFHFPEGNILESHFENLYDKIRAPQYPETIALAYFYLILGAITEYRNAAEKKVLHLSHLQKAITFINMHIHNKLSVADITDYLSLDPSQVYRLFKSELGMSPKNYLIKVKIEKACELIGKSDLNFGEISNLLGFEYVSHFYKIFKKIVGVTPTEYKKSLSGPSLITKPIPSGKRKVQHEGVD
jgi:AraC-like DNA-binding protein